MAVAIAQSCRVRILCTRHFQNKIEESVYTLLKIQIKRFGLEDDFQILKNKIVHRYTGSEFIFYGRARNMDEIKGTEGVDIHWAEEAHMLSEEEWKDIDPTLRKEGSQHWIIFNPRLVSDFVWKRFVVNPPADTIVRQINYDENPFLSATMLKVIEGMRLEDPDLFTHVYLGEPRSDDEAVIIKRSWVLAAIDAHQKLGIKPSGAMRIGWDIADGDDETPAGHDDNATTTAFGYLTTNLQKWKGGTDDLSPSCARVYQQARRLQAHIYYDDIGVGAFAGSRFKELSQLNKGANIRYTGFGAGNKVHNPDDEYMTGVKNKDYFSNLKAQAWWLVADRFRNTYNAVHNGRTFKEDQLIAINGNCEHLMQLVDELSTPRRDFDANGKVKVEGKKDLSKRGIHSPNVADSFIIAYSPIIASTINYGELL